MIRLTSDLDFKLTKKRFLMMGKSVSRVRANTVMLLAAPAVLAVVFVFCTSTLDERSDYVPIKLSVATDGFVYEADPVLYVANDGKRYSVNSPYEYPSNPERFTSEGELFTGKRTFYNRATKKPGWEDIFEDGLLVKKAYLYDVLHKREAKYLVYSFEDSKKIERGYSETDSLIFRSESSENELQTFGANNELIFHAYSEKEDGLTWRFSKAWSHDGQLLVESAFDSTGTNSRWTIYDEKGNLIRHTRYEDGAIVEDINNGEDDTSDQ